MADLGEVLLRTMTPLVQGSAARTGARAKQAGAERVAQIGAESRTAVAGQNKQARIFVALLNAKQSAENLRTKISAANDPTSLKIKASIALAGNWMNRMLAGETPPPDIQNAMTFLQDYLELNPGDRETIQQHSQNIGIRSNGDANWMENIMNNPQLKDIIGKDPALSNEMGTIFQQYQQIKQATSQKGAPPAAAAPGTIAPAAPKAPAAAAPTPVPTLPVTPQPPKGPQIGDIIPYQGKKYTVEGIDAQGKPQIDLSKPIESNNP